MTAPVMRSCAMSRSAGSEASTSPAIRARSISIDTRRILPLAVAVTAPPPVEALALLSPAELGPLEALELSPVLLAEPSCRLLQAARPKRPARATLEPPACLPARAKSLSSEKSGAEGGTGRECYDKMGEVKPTPRGARQSALPDLELGEKLVEAGLLRFHGLGIARELHHHVQRGLVPPPPERCLVLCLVALGHRKPKESWNLWPSATGPVSFRPWNAT